MSEEEPSMQDIPLEARMALASIKVGGAKDVVDAMITALQISKGIGVEMVPVDNVIAALQRVLDDYSVMVSENVL